MHRLEWWTTAAVIAVVLAMTAVGTASATTVYGNIPDPLAGNYPSMAFQATSTSEFGGLVQLATGARTNPVVTVTMSSWGCQTGGGTTCVTTPGTGFTHPITLNVYAVNADNSVGRLLASYTQTFKIPFRPSADLGNCPSGGWYNGASCFNGLANSISWDLGGWSLTLPDKVIVAVAYNTSNWGYQPIGSGPPCHSSAAGCAYDSLNVAVVPNAPFIGVDPLPDDAYISSLWTGAYCSETALNIFRLDAGCWTGYRPAIQVDTFAPAVGPTGPAGADGADGATGATGAAGPAGANGTNGSNGTNGANGTNGKNGKNAVAPLQTAIVKVKVSSTKHTARFWFVGNGGKGKIKFQCRMDNKKYSSCRSAAKVYKRLKHGKHVFRVRAKANGKVDRTPATVRFNL